MSEPIVQADFGGFNPRFPGVTIKFRSAHAFTVFQEFFVSESVPRDQPDLSVVSIRSVLDHEVRHYHDFLISPYSTVIFRMRLQAVLNGMKALQRVRDCAGGYLPAPLVQWVRLDERERSGRAREWAALLGVADRDPLGLVALPYFTDEELQRPPTPGPQQGDHLDDEAFLRIGIEYACRAYMRIDDLLAGAPFDTDFENTGLAPYTLYEVTALAAQAQAIWSAQGEPAFALFYNHLQTANLPYARLWRLIEAVAEDILGRADDTDAAVVTIVQMAAISVWCLLGNYQIEGLSACPTVRFMKLAEHLGRDASARDVATDVGATWDRWDRATGCAPWREAVVAMLAMNERGARQYEDFSSRHEAPDVLGRVMKRFVADQRQAVDRLMAEPGDFVNMQSYLNCPAGTLPFPLVRIEFDGLGVPVKHLNDTAFTAIWTIEHEQEEVATRLALRDKSENFHDRLNDAREFETHMHWCDLVISDHQMPSDVHQHSRLTLEEFLGKKLLFLV
ncbi:MAG: hypothetical protein BroJett029_31090 [Alphaproteobacteria bacterium]|nr:MAG: hypothetical protein BroJett029_31090 [Alphaproteobacteria bacterium]